MSNGRILHTMLRVGDLDKSIEFYTNVTTEYRSIQHYNDNVINPALPGSYEFIDKVLEPKRFYPHGHLQEWHCWSAQ